MKKIPVSDIKDDMILAETIHGNSGQVLFREGCSLKESLVHRLAARGIDFVYITDASEASDNDITPTQGSLIAGAISPALSAMESLPRVFAKSKGSPVMQSIYDQIAIYLKQREA